MKKEKKPIERRATKMGDRIKIEFSFNKRDLEGVRYLPGRKFNYEGGKYWTCNCTSQAVEALQFWGFILDDELISLLPQLNKPIRRKFNAIDVPGLQQELYPFQKEGVGFIESRNGRALVGDDMGLGKTMQALGWLQLHPELRPAIVVVPATVKLLWQEKALEWMDKPSIQVLSGTTPTDVSEATDIIIINYDILPDWIDILKEANPQVLVLDEVHYIKNNKALRTKAVKKLVKGIPHVIGLSGTPALSRPIELYNALRMIDRFSVPNYWVYAEKYCAAKWGPFGWKINGASNTEELHQRLQSVMIRRRKKDVLQELPDKTYSSIPVEMTNSAEYARAVEDTIGWIRENRGEDAADRAANAKAITQIEVLKQIAVKGKMVQAMEWIENFIDINGKLVVFAVHKFVIDLLMEKFKGKVVKIDGSVSQEQRNKAVTEFQTNDKIRLFVGNIKAAGIGITLTAASDVLFLELPWTPGELVQAEDRCHRIGQKNNVGVYYLLAAGTVEEMIAKLIDSKRKVLDAVLDGKTTESTSLLSELLIQMKEERRWKYK